MTVRSNCWLGVTDGEPRKCVVEFTQTIGELRLIEGEVESKPISDAGSIDGFTAEIDGAETVALEAKYELTLHRFERSGTFQRAVQLGELIAKPNELCYLESSIKLPAEPTRRDSNVHPQPVVVVVLANGLHPLVAQDVDLEALVMRTTE